MVNRCRSMEAASAAANPQSNRRDLIEISTLIDLTDKPIGLTRDEISFSRVRATASNCICCCNNNSITLVTTNNSYILDHIPLDNIQLAQTNPSLQYLALSNHSKIVIIDLADGDDDVSQIEDIPSSSSSSQEHRRISSASITSLSSSMKASAALAAAATSTTRPRCSSCQQLKQAKNNNTKDKTTYSQNKMNNNETKVINLVGQNLTMSDIVHWRWIDDNKIGLISHDALYTCSLDQLNINHPAYTALSQRSRYLNLERQFDIHENLTSICQINDIQQDISGNLYTISGLYSNASLEATNNINNYNSITNQQAGNNVDTFHQIYNTKQHNAGTLRPSFGSMPSRLSLLASANEQSRDSLNSEHSFDFRNILPTGSKIASNITATLTRTYSHGNSSNSSCGSSSSTSTTTPSHNNDNMEVSGLIQIHCCLRNRSQIIQAHAVAFTNPHPPHIALQQNLKNPTILVAANKTCDQMRVHFIEMATSERELYSSSGRNSSPTCRFIRLQNVDFPSSIVCSYLNTNESNNTYLHLALITTKHGQLFVCSVAHSTILFSTSITNDIISSTVLESNTQSLMAICRNGQVLLVKLKIARLLKLLDESKSLRHISSMHNIRSEQVAATTSNNTQVDDDIVVKSNIDPSSNNSVDDYDSFKELSPFENNNNNNNNNSCQESDNNNIGDKSGQTHRMDVIISTRL